MGPPLKIEVPDETLAEQLRVRLRAFDAKVEQIDGRYDISVELIEVNPERRVVNVLNAIDTWLVTAGVEAVRIHLDGSVYTLHAPPEA